MQSWKRIVGYFLLLVTTSAIAANDQVFVSTRVLTSAFANKVATVAEQTCSKKGYQVSVAVSDRYGNLLAFSRNPLAGIHTIGVAQDKAYSSASFQSDTLTVGPQLEVLKNVPRVNLAGGGVPIRVGGHIYGAVGVSGAPAQKKPGDEDDVCARAGIAAIKDALEFAE